MKKFRRFFAAAAAVCLAAQMMPVTAGALEPVNPAGDVNRDGIFNLSDMVMFNQWMHGKGSIADTDTADMNGDSQLDVFDFIAMRKQLLGSIVSANAKYEKSGTVDLCGGIKRNHSDRKKIDSTFRNAQLSFSLDLFKHTVKEDENVLISPYSVSMALAMTANGADGETKSEMEKTLGGLPIDDLNGYLAKWAYSQPNEEKIKIHTANSVWVRDDEALIKPAPTFIQSVVDNFGAEVFKAPFNEETVKDVNNWINDHTDGMIPSVIKKFEPYDMMALINAVSFEAKWADQYEDYQIKPHDFTAYDGTVKKTDMLYSTEDYYIEDGNAAGVLKLYDQGRYGFAAILPEEGTSTYDYVKGLTTERMQKLFSGYKSCDVETVIPKFKYESSSSLKDALVDMGMSTAFVDGTADFTKMVTPDSLKLHIGSVIHKTFIELDENGTKAAAATVVMMAGNEIMPPKEQKEVILDRPFVYAIVDMENALPLFIGTVNSIEEE